MKNSYLILVLSIAVVACSCSSSPKGPNMKEGRWDVMVKIDMPDSPFALPPVVYSQCLSREDLIPRKVNENEDQKCDVVESKVNGDTVSWTVVCDTPQGKSTSSGSVTYKGESFEGEIIIEAGENMPAMTQTMSGKRVGSCE